MKTKWRANFRLWGKKRGGRMTGWWFIGSLGEALFFAAFFLFGVLSSTTLIAWQLMSPSTQVIRIGYGFWLFLGVSLSFVVMGTVGFWYRVLKVVTSDEHREVLAQRSIVPEPMIRKTKSILPPTVPDLHLFTDSPGAKLAYRLPSQIPENGALVRTLGIGSTIVEVEELPLVPGESCKLEVIQYGRLVIKKISVRLVCEEESTYHFGTDVRTERQTVFTQVIATHGRDRIDWGYPLRIECEFSIPRDAMHSFQSLHNAIHWKIIVDGEANRWPSYSRSFPVVVYPQNRISRTTAVS